MGSSGKLLYSKGSSLAVHGDDGSPFWICKTNQIVTEGMKSFTAFWYEQEPAQANEWLLTLAKDRVPLLSVIRRTKLKPLRKNVYFMSDSEFKINLKLSEVNDELPSKKKKDKKLVRKPSNKKGSSKVKKVSTKSKKGNVPKKVKVPKVKVDKSNPNWRLKPRDDISEFLVDPFYETSSMDFPFISTTHYSRLIIRSILLKDKQLFNSLLNDKKRVSLLNIRRSLADDRGSVMFAILQEDREAVKSLFSKETSKKPRAPFPIQLIETTSTGVYNFRSLGIRHIRRIEASRGGREGNNALTRKDTGTEDDLSAFVLTHKLSPKFVDFLIAEEILYSSNLLSNISLAFYEDNLELGLHLMRKYSKHTRFTDLHIEALSAKDWNKGTKGMKEASVLKKGEQSITPLHLAALNPNVNVFKSLYSVGPDLWVVDDKKRTPIHYAVSCTQGIEVVKFLDSKSASFDQPDSDGYTPLAIATRISNVKAMEYILSRRTQDDEFISKNGICGIDRPLRNSYCPIHLAAKFGKVDALRVLFKHGVKIDKPLNARAERLTALMIAAAHGHLDVVRCLVEEGRAKVEARDKFKRTTLTHAVMNGASHVASYLLRLGANPNQSDSSGNSNLHYACAYGWYHCVTLLLEAGASPDPLNEWKISPCAIAFLRGHRGLGEYMLKIPGVCGNFQDSKGRTLLMHLLRVSNDSNPEELLSYFTYLLDELKIDPRLKDNEDKNALHYLTECLDPCFRDPQNYSIKASEKIINQIFDILIDKGCSSCQMDKCGNLPIDYLLKSNSNNLNFGLISKCLEVMNTGVSHMEAVKDNSLKTIVYAINGLKLQHLREMKPILCRIVDFYRHIESKKLIDLDKFRRENSDLLFSFCQVYANFPPRHDIELNNMSESIYNQCWDEARSVLEYFLKNFRPSLREKRESQGKFGERSAHSILLNTSNEPLVKENDSMYKAGFEVLFNYDNDLEAVDVDGTTCLTRSIKSNNIQEFKQYIAKGADIFVTHPEKNPSTYEMYGKSDDDIVYRDPLIETIFIGNLEMFNTLLDKGASIPPDKIPDYPISFTAVNQVLLNRNDLDQITILEKIFHLNRFQNATTVNGFNALHISTINSTDDFNINLEIESLLLKSGVNSTLQDKFGRIPLHYVFVKNVPSETVSSSRRFIPGEGNGLEVIDPIEVVSMIIEGMRGDMVDTVDKNGLSPLHYAAFRGSTVCCMLLMDKGADINRKDSFGNTPLTYALAGKHEATTITFLQKGADVNCQSYFNPILMGSPNDEGLDSVKGPAFKYLPSHFKNREKPKFPITLFELSLLNTWLGVSYLILDRMQKHGLRVAEALEVAFKLQKHQLAKKLMLKQMNNHKLCEFVSNNMNLLSALMKYNINNDCQDHVINFLMDHLYRAGNQIQHKDDFGCSPLHYACLSNNIKLIQLLFTYSEVKGTVNETDNNGRTPLFALLWNSTPDAVVESAKILLANGANPNVLCQFKKFDHFHEAHHPGTINLRYDEARNQSLMELTTPLIVGINFRCKPLINLLIENGADLNMQDGHGRTPLMMAVKCNDLDFVNYLLDASKSASPLMDESPPPSKKRKNNQSMQLFINVKDNQGLNAVHHALFKNKPYDGAHDNKDLIKFLLDLGCDHEDEQNEFNVGAIGLAEKMRLQDVYKYLTKQKLRPQKTCSNVGKYPPNFTFPYDVKKDAEAMFDILSKNKNAENVKDDNDNMEIDEENDNDSLKSYSESNYSDEIDVSNHEEAESNELPIGLSLSSGTLYNKYTTLLSKVLVQSTHWGMYNFYRMQIWKDNNKDLFILFTNWGRWGEIGNYQNTPFGTPDQAVQEFEKIYKSKTGNDWSKRNEFIPKPFKYRQLDISSFAKRRRPKINFDLKSDVPSRLPIEVQTSIKHISNVTMYAKAYRDLNIDSDTIPFGQINKKDILKAIELLNEIKILIQEKDSLSNLEDSASKDRLHVVLEDIQNKSNEYFYLMPIREAADTMISPIYNLYTYKEEFLKASHLLEIEFAERVLLGAQYRKNEMNPLDYIYHSLSVQMTPLEPQDEMADKIMKYIYNSKGARNDHHVDAIFKMLKISSGEQEKPFANEESNSKFLWHGTKCVNLLSILYKGLIIDPPYAQRSGHTFGPGIYLADVYDKSFNYCDQNKKYAYILLCKAELGKIFNYTSSHYYSDDTVPKKSERCNSLKVRGRYEPFGRGDINLANGVTIPLGNIIDTKLNDYCTNYNEFVLKEENQVSINYLIRIKVK